MCVLSCSETDCPRLKKMNVAFSRYNSASTKFHTNLEYLLAGFIWVFMVSKWSGYRQFNYLVSAV